MLKCLREVNSDSNSVGWYQSTYLGSYLGQAMIETQFQYQVNSPKSIVVVYGAIRFCNGATVLLKFFFFFFYEPSCRPSANKPRINVPARIPLEQKGDGLVCRQKVYI